METQLEKNKVRFELVAVGPQGNKHVYPITKKRSLIGRGQACDIVIPFNDVSTIHAVIEFDGNSSFKVFDLDSKNGTHVNNERVVVGTLSPNQTFMLGVNKVEIKPFVREDLPPAPLAVLDREIPRLPPTQEELSPPKSPVAVRETPTNAHVPHVEYPLSKDPSAEFSEYIFEDADNLYPIFKYEVGKSSVEVIIVFNDRIQSVDYIPSENGTYSLVGAGPSGHDIEYPYLGKKEKFPIVKMANGEAEIYTPVGYSVKSIGSSHDRSQVNAFILDHEEIIQFSNQHIQIYVRSTEKPPRVAPAPVFRRDKELKKYMFLMLFLVFSILLPVTMFEVDEEVEKEKAPERIATILYKRKLTASKSKAIDKTKDAPKKKIQKSPKQVVSKKKPKELPKEKPQKKVTKTKTAKKSGSKNSTKVGKVKKVTANKGPKNVKKDIVRPPTSAKKVGSSGTTRSARRANTNSKSRGAVDTYKSADFSSSISNLMSKGGSTKSYKAASASSTGFGTSAISGSETGATLKTAKVSNNTGSLSGVASGKLDSAKGVEGLVDKKNIYTAGLPFKTVILGGLDPDIIRQILVENIPKFRYCYQKVLDRSKNAFNGIVKLNFIIGASGHVTKAGVDSVTNIPGTVRGCVVNVLRRIRFPEPRGGGVTEVSQPMNFYPRVN
tara:strand:+ start:59539 stop:61533 length:1995 start_codon:yes stop_codon:yes gene_type:complete